MRASEHRCARAGSAQRRDHSGEVAARVGHQLPQGPLVHTSSPVTSHPCPPPPRRRALRQFYLPTSASQGRSAYGAARLSAHLPDKAELAPTRVVKVKVTEHPDTVQTHHPNQGTNPGNIWLSCARFRRVRCVRLAACDTPTPHAPPSLPAAPSLPKDPGNVGRCCVDFVNWAAVEVREQGREGEKVGGREKGGHAQRKCCILL